ncbi:MAG: sigma-70 family RNA polymerase sigma factor [Deltaproteobacteria bacterium]|nr:sigma-70 family RNA polymerase sigma factor [Deltaproteobacteria bacterium]
MASQAKKQQKGTTNPAIDENLIKKHMPLVQKLARRMASRAPASIATDDLFSAGSLGLVDSVLRNRGGDGASFACYVRMRIRGAIYDELRANDWLPRRSRSKDKEEQTSGPAKPVAVIRFDDLPAGPESNPENKEKRTNPFDALTAKRTFENLQEALNAMPKRDKLVLHLHYFKGMQIREIGRLLGVSEARISQIHHRALCRIRPLIKSAA